MVQYRRAEDGLAAARKPPYELFPRGGEEAKTWELCLYAKNPTTPEEAIAAEPSHAERLIAREQDRNRAQQAEVCPAASPTFTELRPWLERTGWQKTYRDADRLILAALITLPPTKSHQPLYVSRPYGRQAHEFLISAADENKIRLIARAVEPVISRCEATIETSGRTALYWLRSVRSTCSYPKPFLLVGKKATRTRYISVLCRFVCFVFRLYRLQKAGRAVATGTSFTPEQLTALEAVWNRVSLAEPSRDPPTTNDKGEGEGEGEGGDEDDSVYENSEDAEDEDAEDEDDKPDEDDKHTEEFEGCETGESKVDDDDDGNLTVFSNDRPLLPDTEDADLYELLFGVLMLFATEPVPDGTPSKTLLVYFTGILGFSADHQSFRPPRDFTTHLAALVYLLRLLFLEFAIPARGYVHLGIPRRPKHGRLERLQNVRRRYTIHGTESVFDEVFNLMCYGRKAAADQTPSTLLHWGEDGQSVRVGDTPSIAISDMRALDPSRP